MQRFTSFAYWHCPQCEHVNSQDICVPELNFSAERMSEMTVDDVTEICCDQCETIFNGHVWVYSDSTEFNIEDLHEFTFQGDMPMYEPEEEFEQADDPHSIALEALELLNSMVGSEGPRNDPQFTNRLVFAGAVACLEAYLGDTLINEIRDDSAARDQLLKNDRNLGGEKLTAASLVENHDALTTLVVSKLRTVLYHRLGDAKRMYRQALGIDIFPSDDEREFLFPAMQLRHDCVHRNGRDKEGKKLTSFTEEYVHSAIAAIRAVVDHVEFTRTDDLEI